MTQKALTSREDVNIQRERLYQKIFQNISQHFSSISHDKLFFGPPCIYPLYFSDLSLQKWDNNGGPPERMRPHWCPHRLTYHNQGKLSIIMEDLQKECDLIGVLTDSPITIKVSYIQGVSNVKRTLRNFKKIGGHIVKKCYRNLFL